MNTPPPTSTENYHSEEEVKHDIETQCSKAAVESECSDNEEDPIRLWLLEQQAAGVPAQDVLSMFGYSYTSEESINDAAVWKMIIRMGAQLVRPSTPPRHKLPHINTLDHVVALLQQASNILVLTGAGISVSCGIPDFRSENGIYSVSDFLVSSSTSGGLVLAIARIRFTESPMYV